MKRFTLLLALLLALLPACQVSPSQKKYGLEAHFISVGQGDCILIQCQDKYMLIDSGTADASSTVLSYLKGLGVSRLDIILATHPHEDHIGSMAEIIAKYPPRLFLMPDATHSTTAFFNMLDAVKKSNCETEFVYSGCEYTLNDAKITVYNPAKDAGFSDLNAVSAVIMIEYDGARILLTGDAERDVEQNLLALNIPPADILKIGHHGSFTSTSPEFFNYISPEIAVISCGKNNDYGHPHKEVLALLEKSGCSVYRTDTDGSIVIGIEKGEFYVSISQ